MIDYKHTMSITIQEGQDVAQCFAAGNPLSFVVEFAKQGLVLNKNKSIVQGTGSLSSGNNRFSLTIDDYFLKEKTVKKKMQINRYILQGEKDGLCYVCIAQSTPTGASITIDANNQAALDKTLLALQGAYNFPKKYNVIIEKTSFEKKNT